MLRIESLLRNLVNPNYVQVIPIHNLMQTFTNLYKVLLITSICYTQMGLGEFNGKIYMIYIPLMLR